MAVANQDTIELLKECNAGVKMGVDSIAEVLDHVQSSNLKQLLNSSKEEHQKIGSEVHQVLNRYDESGKEPNPMAKSMSWLKTSTKLAVSPADETVADLITDGCNMGVKSLIRYRNRYPNASEAARSIAGQLIDSEQLLCKSMQPYL